MKLTPEELGTQIGMWIGIVGVLALVVWSIWALIKYKPFSVTIKMIYDLRKFVVNIVLMYGNKPSLFSLKRFNTGLITYWCLITASLFIRHNKMSATDFILIIVPFLAAAGYNVFQSQQDKKMASKDELDNKITDNATDLGNKIIDNDAANK